MSSTDNLMGYLKKKPGRLGPGVIVVMHFYGCHDLWAASSVLAAVIILRMASWRDIGAGWTAIQASRAARSAGGSASMIFVAPVRGRPRNFFSDIRKYLLQSSEYRISNNHPVSNRATQKAPRRAMETTMASYAADYDRRATPATHMWYSVETPRVFREYRLAVEDAAMTRTQRRQYRDLLDLAERYGARIVASPYRRG